MVSGSGFRAAFFTFITGLFLLAASSAATAQEDPADGAGEAVITGRAMIVLDASGSMWGQIEGQNKIVIAREVVADLMSEWDPDVALGLTAYGHRRKGDCGDIETLVPVGRGTAGQIAEIVNSLNPKGKTPISESLQRAGEALRISEEPASVILVTDGLETCEADPCAVAKALEETGVDFTAHVVGFDITEEEGESLQCIADLTGGRYLRAGNAGELRTALGEAVKELPKADPVRVDVVLAEGQEPLENVSAKFEFFPAAATDEEPLRYSYGDTAAARLEPGDYIVKATLGAAAGQTEFSVTEDGPRRFTVDLNAARIAVEARLGKQGAEMASQLGWKIFPLDDTGAVAGSNVGYAYGPKTVFVVPAGAYRVTVGTGGAHAQADYDLKAGDDVRHMIDMRAGTLVFDAVLAPGGPKAEGNFGWRAYRLAADGQSRGEQASYSYGSGGRYLLTNGPYILTVKAGGISREKRVDIAPEETTTVSVNLDGGFVEYSAVPTPGAEKVSSSSYGWRAMALKNDGSAGDTLAYSYTGSGTYLLPAGEHILRFQGGAVTKTKRITVTAGQRKAEVIDLDAGFVEFDIVKANGDPIGRSVLWRLYQMPENRSISYGSSRGSRLLAPAGRHEIRVSDGNIAGTAPVDVIAGQTSTVTVRTNAP